MNFKRIIQFNNLRSQLTEPELTLADALRTATESERELLVESLQPEQPKKPERSQQARCTYVYGSGLVCNGASRNIVHHNSAHLDFHQFTTEKQKKSKHAQSIGGAIRRTPKSKVDDDDANKFDDKHAQAARVELCTFIIEATGEQCEGTENDTIHDMTYSSSHQFQPRIAVQAASGD